MPTLTQRRPQPLMHFYLKPLKRDSLPINTDVAMLLPLGNNTIGANFLVVDILEVEKRVVFHTLECLDCAVPGEVASDADEVETAVCGERGGEEVCICRHVGNVSGVKVSEVVVGDH